MIYQLSLLFISFIIYSFLGYLVEVTCASINDKKFTISRGFLIGPIIPIFGLGAILIIQFLTKYSDDLITLFVLSTVICSILEYITSYIMEKIFKMRWWDYSDKKFNLNGRIAFDFAIYFGIGGVLMLKFVHPFISNILLNMNENTIITIGIILFILFLIDLIISTNIIFKFKDNVTKLVKKDSTMKIKSEVRRVLKERSLLTIRLIKAFPNIDLFSKENRITKIQKLILDKSDFKDIKRIRKRKK